MRAKPPCSISNIAFKLRVTLKRAVTIALLLITPAASLPVLAYETDQFTNRLVEIKDSREVLNAKVNRAIQEVADEWQGPRDDFKFVTGIWKKIGGVHWVDRLERFAMKSEAVAKLPTPRHDTIYSNHPIYVSRVAGMFGAGQTLKLSGTLIGTDKLGHFLSQGRKYYRRWLKLHDERKAAEQSAYTERAIFGQLTTGAYANADLVANYEGHRFYRSLFEDDIVPNQSAILKWDDAANRWLVQRAFDFNHHVNEYWDEALNVNHFDRVFKPHLRERLQTLCATWAQNPAAFDVEPERDAELQLRYANLQLRDTRDMRLGAICQTTDQSQLEN